MKAILANFFDPTVAQRSATLLWIGVINLIRLDAVAFLLALLLGIAFAMMRNSQLAGLRQAEIWFADTVRSLPPLVSLVVVFYLTPPVYGISLNAYQAAVLTFGIIQGAYIGEIYHGGLLGVSGGQRQAALALGLTGVQTSLYVVAPQVFRIIIPPLTNQATQLVRDSSLAYFIGYQEVVTQAKLAVSASSNSTPYTMAVAIYLLLLTSLQLLSTHLERWGANGRWAS
jgi:His/Glu/Gln/Arg/opine family amino acid ABC transporter permease subunit